MTVRRPLPPCSCASHSIDRSQICQNGLDQRPATKREVDAVHTVVEHQHDEQVAEDQDDQCEAGEAHEQPGVHLEVVFAGRRGERGLSRLAGRS